MNFLNLEQLLKCDFVSPTGEEPPSDEASA